MHAIVDNYNRVVNRISNSVASFTFSELILTQTVFEPL